MRHRKDKVVLDRSAAPRRALLRALALGLITHGHIVTTQAKSRAVSSFVERLITVAKKNTLAARRQLISTTGSASVAERLLKTVAPRFKEVKGGYTRRIPLRRRMGDGAPIVKLEFTKES